MLKRVVDRAVVNTVESKVSRGILVGCMVVTGEVLVVDLATSLIVESANNLKGNMKKNNSQNDISKLFC